MLQESVVILNQWTPPLLQLFLPVLTVGVIPVRITPPLLCQGDVSPWLPLFAGNKRLKEVTVKVSGWLYSEEKVIHVFFFWLFTDWLGVTVSMSHVNQEPVT